MNASSESGLCAMRIFIMNYSPLLNVEFRIWNVEFVQSELGIGDIGIRLANSERYRGYGSSGARSKFRVATCELQLLYVMVRVRDDVGVCTPDDNGQAETDEHDGGDEPHVDAAADKSMCLRNGRCRHAIGNRDRLRPRAGTLFSGARHDSPGEKRESERQQSNHEQGMARVLARNHAQRREHRRQRAEPGNPDGPQVGHAAARVFADDHPGEKRADGQTDAGGQRHEIAAHSRPEHVPDRHACASFHSSYHAIWIASSLGSFDRFGSSSQPSSVITRSRRSVNRSVSGSWPGNFSARAMPMSSESVHFMASPPAFSAPCGPICPAECRRLPARSSA